MNARGTSAPVKQSVAGEAPLEHAFKVFTEEFGSFTPPEHNLLGAEIAETVFEPRVGSHICDRGDRWPRRSLGTGALRATKSHGAELGYQSSVAN